MARRKKYKYRYEFMGIIIIVGIILIKYYIDDVYDANNIYKDNTDIPLNLSMEEIFKSEHTDDLYFVINNNIPYFTDEDYETDTFEKYSSLDIYSRCGVAFANINKNLMPTTKRERLRDVRPSGWHLIKYDIIEDGKYLYNRCHLIGYQLTGENANPRNLITCTRQMNTLGMLQFENKVAEYVRKTNNNVLYRVTPIFKDNELLARGVEIEASSVKDHCKDICFNVFVNNIQDGIEIDYSNGDSKLVE